MTSHTPPFDSPSPEASTQTDPKKAPLMRAVLASMIGNTFEWYDFALFGYFAPIIGDLFFPSDNPTTRLLSVFAAFAVGYVFRPLGGLLFGYIGDKYGRRNALILTIMLMAVPTTIIGILPTYEQWGISASVILVLMRILQGISMGGNYGGAITFTTEQVEEKKRALFGSFASASCLFGILVGSATAAAFNAMYEKEALYAYGWRIPFLIGVVICVVGLYMRRRLSESHTFETAKKEGTLCKNPTREVFSKHRKTLLNVVLVVMLHDLSFYILFVYMTTFFNKVMGLDASASLIINSINLVIVMVSTVVSALLSDRFGKEKVLGLAALFFVFTTIPLMSYMLSTHHYGAIFATQMLFAIAAGTYFGPTAAFIVEAYPTHVRYTAVSLTTNISGPLFGGTAPFVITSLIEYSGNPLVPAFYLTLAASASFLAIRTASKRRAKEKALITK
jgi:MHS family proline/betaine transporter-like MFS transporter